MLPIRVIPSPVQVYPIYVQPGDTAQNIIISVRQILAKSETVSSAQADDTQTVIAATAADGDVLIDVAGPANGVQKPVRLTVHGSLGSSRVVSLLVIGKDPFAAFVPQTPNIFLRWRGGYSETADYLPYDLVLYGGIIYLALVASTGSSPDAHPTQWMAWAGTGGGGGGGSNIYVDTGGTGRMCTYRHIWVGPGDDDWSVAVVGVQ